MAPARRKALSETQSTESVTVTKTTRKSRTKRIINDSDDDDDQNSSNNTTKQQHGDDDDGDELEDVKPVIKKSSRSTRTTRNSRGSKGSSATQPPISNASSSNQNNSGSDDDEAPPPPPKKRSAKTVKKKQVIEDDEEEVQEQVTIKGEEQEQERPSTPIQTPAIQDEEPVPSTPENKLPSPTPPTANNSDSEDEELQQQQPPTVKEDDKVPAAAVPAPQATAYDLVAQARLAAINHAATEKDREKELEGKPRLVIHQMVLEDFKSYRGRGVIGPFHKSFSSVVGPNGSGKSNTIDALLFVFGYRATKMRQGKLSELIHNSGSVVPPEEQAASQDMDGVEFEDDDDSEVDSEEEEWENSKKKGKKGKGKAGKGKKKTAAAQVQSEAGLIGQCTVEVWFREIIDLPGYDNFEVVPGSQLVVARTAYRNNSSRYTINGKTSSFTEVTTLLKDRGIDLQHNRFLILQGEVESIAQMKPKGATEHDEGLLEYLEDIIGTSKYKSEIEKAVVEVERLNDARGHQLNRVKLVEREKSALEGRKKECDGYLKDQNELVHNQSALWQYNIHQASANGEVYREALEEAQAELEMETKEQEGTRKQVESDQAEVNQLDADTKAVEKETNEVLKELAVLERADVQLQEKKKSLVAKIKKLNKSVTDDTHNRSEAETWIRNHTEEIERVRKELDKMEATLETEEAELEKVRDGLKGKTEVFSTQIESLQQELQPWAAKIAAKQAEVDLANNDRDLLLEKTEAVKAGIKEAEKALEKIGNDDTEKTDRLKELKAERKAVEKDITSAESKIEGMQAEDAKLRAKASAARQKADEAKASQSASRSQGNVLTSLTKLKDQGRLSGFHGRLGNLGRIDPKYDVAISTACVGLDNLVAETISVGQACIEHIRKNDLGRVQVMCLDKITPRDMAPIQTPENAPRLFDLITVKEPKFAPCFFQLLTNTLVASDLEQGKRIAFGTPGKRFRVVTLDGQVIDTSGTMSGGGGRPMKGRMSDKIAADTVSPEQVAKCEQEQTHAVEALRVFNVNRQEIEKELSNLRKRLPEIDMSISKTEMDLKTGGKRREEAEKRLAELKTQSKPETGDVKLIAQLEKDIAALNKELAQLEKESEAIEGKIKVLQEKILEVGGVKLRSQQTKVSDLKKRIDHASDRITKAEVGKAKSTKDQAKLTKSIESNQASIESNEAELGEINTQIQQGVHGSGAVRELAEKAQEMLIMKREELAEKKKILDKNLVIINQFRKREHELQQVVTSQQKLLNESQKEIEHWSARFEELTLNEIESDDEDEEADGEASERPPKADRELHEYTADEVADLDVKVLKAKIAALEDRISKSTLDLSILKEYARREKEFMQRAADLDAVTKERDAAKKLADDLRSQRLREFMEGFGIISMKLKEMYQMITLGGNAELELVDSLDPFSEGIIFSVMPPKKSWKNISNLSGGEKTLSSLALVFALHVFKPTPLYFMDEIDAALDFRNVSIVANYIRDRTKHAQFVVISLRNNMFELSSRLIGIYKTNNQTRSIAIDNQDLVEVGA
ncbi:RecF/RecN/SMC protein [Meredithblackwellia eburnea MCA 4105]